MVTQSLEGLEPGSGCIAPCWSAKPEDFSSPSYFSIFFHPSSGQAGRYLETTGAATSSPNSTSETGLETQPRAHGVAGKSGTGSQTCGPQGMPFLLLELTPPCAKAPVPDISAQASLTPVNLAPKAYHQPGVTWTPAVLAQIPLNGDSLQHICPARHGGTWAAL